MKIFTTPMCKEVVRLAGVPEYTVVTDNKFTGADLAIVLSETDTNVPSIKIKLNTFKQIYMSIDQISSTLSTKKLDIDPIKKDYSVYANPIRKVLDERKKIKVKVYSNFIRDIIEDMGFTLVDENPDFLVFPDYYRDDLNHNFIKEINFMGSRALELPSHKNTPLNPLERAKMRYHILENKLCTRP